MKHRHIFASKLLALVLSVAMLASVSVYAFDDYDSSTDTYRANGTAYDYWSTLFVDGSKYRTATWIQAPSDIPAGQVGAEARLYNGDTGSLISSSGMKYSTSDYYFHVVYTNYKTVSSSVYSKGKVAIKIGSDVVTLDSRKTATVGGSSRLAALAQSLDAEGNYPVNLRGETYGSAMLSDIVGNDPDLIAAVGIGGTDGYVRADDLSAETTKQEIPLYNVQGTTVIGSFALAPSDTVEIVGKDIADVRAELASGGTYDPFLLHLAPLLVNGDYPKNSKGETYGPEILSELTGYAPDLILAQGTNGETGYIRESDDPAYKCLTMTPKDCSNYQRMAPPSSLIPLYDSEGQVIGKFELSGFSPEVAGKSLPTVRNDIRTASE